MIKDTPDSGRNNFREDVIKEKKPEQERDALENLDVRSADHLQEADS